MWPNLTNVSKPEIVIKVNDVYFLIGTNNLRDEDTPMY